MDNIINKNIKYPKSSNNVQCIGPCYKQKTWIIHPITLDYITDTDESFCPTNLQQKKMPNGKIEDIYIDTCNIPTHQSDISKKELAMALLIPHIDFNPNEFLKIYYNIFSFEDALNWLEKNSHLSINSKIRVIDTAFTAYSKTLDIVDYRLVIFIIDLIKYKWINNIYNHLNKYINIVNNNVVIINPSSNRLESDDHLIIRMNYLIDLFSEIEIQKFLEKYIKYNMRNSNNINSYLDNIKLNLIEYFEQKMLKTLNK